MGSLLWGVLRASAVTIAGSIIGGGLLLWLEANDIDLKLRVANALQIAQSPEHLIATSIALSILTGAVVAGAFYSIRSLIAMLRRPPVRTAQALRSALIAITEDALDVFPDDARANVAVGRLRTVIYDLGPYKELLSESSEVVRLTDDYVGRVRTARRSQVAEAADVAAVHDEVLSLIRGLLRKTSWAIASEDKVAIE